MAIPVCTVRLFPYHHTHVCLMPCGQGQASCLGVFRNALMNTETLRIILFDFIQLPFTERQQICGISNYPQLCPCYLIQIIFSINTGISSRYNF